MEDTKKKTIIKNESLIENWKDRLSRAIKRQEIEVHRFAKGLYELFPHSSYGKYVIEQIREFIPETELNKFIEEIEK